MLDPCNNEFKQVFKFWIEHTSRELVPVKHAKVGEAQGQLAVGACAGAEDEAVPGAIHGLQPELSLLHVQKEHVLLQTETGSQGLDSNYIYDLATGVELACFSTQLDVSTVCM